MGDKTQTVRRPEDMSPDGYLELIWQEDGDVIVVVRATNDGTELRSPTQSVEFCASGGRSHRTLAALRELFRAMELDNDALQSHETGAPDEPALELRAGEDMERRVQETLDAPEGDRNVDLIIRYLLIIAIKRSGTMSAIGGIASTLGAVFSPASAKGPRFTK